MGEWIKIALKASLVIVMMVVIWGLCAALPWIPAFTFSDEMRQGLAFAKGVMTYWFPDFPTLFALCVAAIALELGILLLKLTLNLTKWLYQVFE